MKPETLHNYQDRCDAAIRSISVVYNNMKEDNPQYARLDKLFNRANSFRKYLLGDTVQMGKTIETSAKLQALELSVERWMEGLPEEDFMAVADAKDGGFIVVQVEEGSTQHMVTEQLTNAQQAIRLAYTTITNKYKMSRNVPAVVKLDDLAKQITQAMQDINRLEF